MNTNALSDLKATALMKLTYLEMFGHDMSWASFNVLEVMAAPKYEQKRVGYLAAVQSFRSDTEVLMLAENQLKKVWPVHEQAIQEIKNSNSSIGSDVSVSSDYRSAIKLVTSCCQPVYGKLAALGPTSKARPLTCVSS